MNEWTLIKHVRIWIFTASPTIFSLQALFTSAPRSGAFQFPLSLPLRGISVDPPASPYVS